MYEAKQVYLDNAASSYPKPMSVYRGVTDFIKNNGANPGRSGHTMSEKASLAVFETREKAAGYFDTSSNDIIFTKNATEALNAAVFSAFKAGKRRFLVSVMEHNSVLRPIEYLKKSYGIRTDYFLPDNFDEKFLKTNPDAVICTAASNVTGNLMPIEEISRECEDRGVLFIVDASQTAGHIRKNCGDVVCTAGHKGLYGLQGSGVLAVRTERGRKIMRPWLFGGTGTDSLDLYPELTFPESFEAGTLNTPAIVSLGLGLEFVNRNEKEIFDREKRLQNAAFGYLSEIKGIRFYTDSKNSVPIIAFNLEGVSSEEMTASLSDMGVFVRGGYHCAPLCHRNIGTVPGGAVRISFGAFNTENDVYRLIGGVKRVSAARK